MEYRYGYEEIDYVDGTQDWVWNAPQHVFFLRIRELFDAELCELYARLESEGCWSAISLINEFNEWQAQFPEELWRLDIQRKYIRTYTTSYINDKAYPEFLTERANGRKKSQRSQFERNQEKYMSSKFSGTVASADDIILRCSVPNTELAVQPNFNMHLTPYSHVYLNVKYNTAPPVRVRAVPNQEYTIEYTDALADIIEIYSASCLKSIGDLSACYLTNGTFAQANKIRELILGNGEEGYNNSNVMTLGLGSNELLNKLDVQNMSGLTHSLDLSGLKNLEELYAFGSGTSGVIFADGGNIRIAELPSVGSLQMKNLNYLDDEGLNVTSYQSLTKLVAENTLLDLIEILENSHNLYQIRLTGIDWSLEDTTLLERLYKLAGVTNTGGNSDQSVIAGKIRIPVIKQQQLYDYQEAWPDLEIEYNSMINQFAVTFVNYDGTVLDVQYVDEGGYAEDPITREDKPIEIPVRESTISTNYVFSNWDTDISAMQVFEPKTVTAEYASTIRTYTIKYVSKGITLQTSVGDYGSNISYIGNIPTYTAEENAYRYYLFNRWDKSGFLDGDFDENGVKTVNAIFDDFRYTLGSFDGKELSDLSPVEIYALTKLTEPVDKEISDYGLNIETGDEYSFVMGYDVDYDDIESELLVKDKTYLKTSESTNFSGAHYIDTGIKLFDTDKDFVIALDYKISSDSANSATLMQCYQTAGTNGFKLTRESSSLLTWGGNSTQSAPLNNREMLVIRHIKGENNLHVYVSNLASDSIQSYVIEKGSSTQSSTATLVFGAAKQDSGRFVNYAIGEINWCKIWYKDLGELVCGQLANWIHEKISLETSGFYRYQLHDDYTKESMISLLCSHLLNVVKKWNTSGNSGGWANAELNTYLNTRFYEAIPYQIRALIKKVSVASVAGNNSTDTTSSGCYITIPALYDVNDTLANDVYRSEVYDPNGTINFFTGLTNAEEATNRKRAFDGGEYFAYWLRSPAIGTWDIGYVWRVDENGNTQPITNPSSSNLGILIELSF